MPACFISLFGKLMAFHRSRQDQRFFGFEDQYVERGEGGNHFQNGAIKMLDQYTPNDLYDVSTTTMDIEFSSPEVSDLYQAPWPIPPVSSTPWEPEKQYSLPPNEIGRIFTWDSPQSQPAALHQSQWAQDTQRRIRTSPEPLPMGYGSSNSTKDIEYKPETDPQRRECSECGKCFEGLRSLEEHARRESHKAWKCLECGKAYGLRTTFQRHRATHREGVHNCVHCERNGKRKVFKRKDHLKEHVRNCHAGSSDTSRSNAASDVAGFKELVHMSIADNDGDGGFSESPLSFSLASACSEDEKSTPKQQEAMKHIVKSLGDVLGRRHHKLIGSLESLESSMNAMSGSKIESVAESMAELALAKTLLSQDIACSR